jgi:hypothetical protein
MPDPVCQTHCWHIAAPAWPGDRPPPRCCCWCGQWCQEHPPRHDHGPHAPEHRWEAPQRQLAQAMQAYAMQMASLPHQRTPPHA